MNINYEIIDNYRGTHYQINNYRRNTTLTLITTYSITYGSIVVIYKDIFLQNILYSILFFFGLPAIFTFIYKIIQNIYMFYYPDNFNYLNRNLNILEGLSDEYIKQKIINNHFVVEDSDIECPICMENNIDINLNCTRKLSNSELHGACLTCLIEWVKKDNSCHICRKKILTDEMLY